MRSLKPYLERQADRVEAVLSAHRTPGRVTGGSAGPRVIRFDVQPAPHIRLAQIAALADDLALALQVQSVKVSLGDYGAALEFANPNPQPISLVALLDDFGPLPVGTAVLGLAADGIPLSARLSSPDVAHILIAGTTGSGKSVLLRTITASLLLSNDPAALSILAIDPKGRLFPKGFACPHLLRGRVLQDGPEALEALLSLTRLMDARDRRGECLPRIAIVIDELADLVMTASEGVERALIRIAQRGREAGVHLVCATQRPSAAILSGLMRANFPLRLVGRCVSPEDSRIAAGRGGVGADKLIGRGDFLAVTGGDAIRFQAPFTRVDDLRTLALSAALPALELPEVAADDGNGNGDAGALAVDDLEVLTTRLAPWWERHGRRYGAKSGALRFLFGDDAPTGGYFWDMTQAAIDRLTTSTSTSTELLPTQTAQYRQVGE